MNFEKYAAELEKHNDQLLEQLNKADRAQAAERPFQRTHKPSVAPAPTEAVTAGINQNKVQSALFPGVDPKLARFLD